MIINVCENDHTTHYDIKSQAYHEKHKDNTPRWRCPECGAGKKTQVWVP